MLDLCSLKPLLAALAHRISCPVVIFPHVGVMVLLSGAAASSPSLLPLWELPFSFPCVSSGLPFMMCRPYAYMGTWPRQCQTSATSPLASALAPGAAEVEAASVLWLHWDGNCRSPRDRLIRVFHSFSNSCNHNARFYSYSSGSYMNVDSSVALMGTDPWSWCSSRSDRVRWQRVCIHEQKTTSKGQNLMTFLLP